MNRVWLIGRLCNNPEFKTTQTGKSVARYRLAVDRRFKQEGQPTADFLNCVAWGKNAEFVAHYLDKGVKIAVEGAIQTGSYTKQDGTTAYTTDIIVDHHEFVESKGAAQTQSAQAEPAASYAPQQTDFTQVDDDELPF